jgi:hypothetical protein
MSSIHQQLNYLGCQPNDVLYLIASFLEYTPDTARWGRTSQRFDTIPRWYERSGHRSPHNKYVVITCSERGLLSYYEDGKEKYTWAMMGSTGSKLRFGRWSSARKWFVGLVVYLDLFSFGHEWWGDLSVPEVICRYTYEGYLKLYRDHHCLIESEKRTRRRRTWSAYNNWIKVVDRRTLANTMTKLREFTEFDFARSVVPLSDPNRKGVAASYANFHHILRRSR